jgi:hypothetical protein
LDSLGLARTLWLQGHPSQSAECTRQTVKDAESRNHPASLAVALSWAPGIFLLTTRAWLSRMALMGFGSVWALLAAIGLMLAR